MFKILEIWYYPENTNIENIKANPSAISIGYSKIINNILVEKTGKQSNLWYVLSNPSFKILKVNTKKSLNIQFNEFFQIIDEDKTKIDKLKTIFSKNSNNTLIYINGFADSIGDVEYTNNISLKYANSVGEYITEKFGLDRLNCKCFGCGNGLTSNENSKRIEIFFCSQEK